MAQRRTSEILVRQWRLLASLGGTPMGCTVYELTTQLNVSRSTLYRDLMSLRRSGVAIESHAVSGKVKLRLCRPRDSNVTPSPLQLAALQFARRSLAPLDGTPGIAELDALLACWSPPSAKESLALAQTVRRDATQPSSAAFACEQVESLDVEPMAHCPGGGDPCLVALDTDESVYRRFQVASIIAAEVLTLADNDPRTSAATSAPGMHRGATSSEAATIEVVARLSCTVAQLAERNAMGVRQQVQYQEDGSIVIRAWVSELADARRWVLSWGAEAEALAPEELRAELAEEAHRMDTLYWRSPFRLAKTSISDRREQRFASKH